MSEIKYYIKRVFKLDYSKMFDTVDRLSKKYNRSKIVIFNDMLKCAVIDKAGYTDYEFFNMYNLNSKQRKTIMTRGRSNHYVKTLNPKEYWHFFDNKNEFNEKFNKYLGRDWFYINENNQEEFLDFIKDKEYVIVKPNDLSCGKGVRKIKISKDEKENIKLFKELLNTKAFLIEEVATQNKELSRLHSSSINTIRVATVVSDYGVANVLSAVIRIGTGNSVVDNFNNGGITAKVNEETGVIETVAINSKGTLFEKHPDSKVTIKGFQIPNWDKIIALVLEASMVVKENRLVGWDVCLSEKGPILIEGNPFPSHSLYSPIIDENYKVGIVPKMEELIKAKSRRK